MPACNSGEEQEGIYIPNWESCAVHISYAGRCKRDIHLPCMRENKGLQVEPWTLPDLCRTYATPASRH